MHPDGTPGPPSPAEEPTEVSAGGTVDESTLLPVHRDWRFVYRLVSLLIIGLMAATYLGMKLQGAAAGCGASLVRPGATVIPPEGPARR